MVLSIDAFIPQCCRIATIPGRTGAPCGRSAPRENVSLCCGKALAAAAEDLNFEIADFLAQRIAIDPEEIGRAYLIAPSGCERHRQERMLDLPQHAMVEAR